MNSNFDLNINNYRKEELEDIFELPLNYDSLTLEMRENKLREKIYSGSSETWKKYSNHLQPLIDHFNT